MANVFTTEVIQEGARNVNVKLVGILDTSDLASTIAVDVSALNCGGTLPTPTQVRVDKIEYSISNGIGVQLLWDATTDVVLTALAGRGEILQQRSGGINNNAGAGKTGDILVKTTGYSSGTQTFTILLDLIKQGPEL